MSDYILDELYRQNPELLLGINIGKNTLFSKLESKANYDKLDILGRGIIFDDTFRSQHRDSVKSYSKDLESYVSLYSVVLCAIDIHDIKKEGTFKGKEITNELVFYDAKNIAGVLIEKAVVGFYSERFLLYREERRRRDHLNNNDGHFVIGVSSGLFNDNGTRNYLCKRAIMDLSKIDEIEGLNTTSEENIFSYSIEIEKHPSSIRYMHLEIDNKR